MKILYYDCFSGISGDMNLGALIDLGVDREYLLKELSKLNLDSEYEIKIQKRNRMGIEGIKVDVILQHKHDEHHHHVHRNLKDIEEIINSSTLNDNVKKMSLSMFIKIAEAEAKVHGKSLYEVHFHEVGATDSIIDIVGAAICIDYLKPDKIMASHVELGGGFVKCAHGLIPVPAPATVEILKGIPIKAGIVSFETTTPTGAAILAANVDEFTDKIDITIEKVGYGVGTRNLEIPNVLRVYLGKEKKTKITDDLKDTQYIIETNIDDMNPELYSYVEKKLFAGGALDVYKTPIIMKKGRPAIKLNVLVNEKNKKNIQEIIFKETTSIGIRQYKVEKVVLERDFIEVKTKYGNVTVKNSYYQGKLIKYKPEYEGCQWLAEENNVSIGEIYREINKAIEEFLEW